MADESGGLGELPADAQRVDRIAGKWSLLTIALLDDGPRRFTELQRMIAGISQRMLSATLRQAERDGLVTRTVHPVVPPPVDDELTALGSTMLETIQALVAWTEEHQAEIAAARSRYDTGRDTSITAQPQSPR